MNATLKDRIGTLARQYLSRVVDQRVELHQAVECLAAGEFYRLGDIYDLTHQIKGAAGTFGFQKIAATADSIHTFVLEVDPDRLDHRMPILTGLMIDFDLAVSDAIGDYAEKRLQRRPEFRQIFRE